VAQVDLEEMGRLRGLNKELSRKLGTALDAKIQLKTVNPTPKILKRNPTPWTINYRGTLFIRKGPS
jgi:hypothetical protein